MIQRVVLTGINGFAGRHLAAFLDGLASRPRIAGLDLAASATAVCDEFYSVDLSDTAKVAEVIRRFRPDCIIHLAGTFAKDSWPRVYQDNVLSLVSLLEAARADVPQAVLITAGTAAEYGRLRPDQSPVTETCPCQPISPYGLSKRLATEIAQYYHRVHGLAVMVVRPFQLIGKGVSAALAPGAFARQLRQATTGQTRQIEVGNLQSVRDFLHVQDAVEAIWTLCQKPAPGEVFNLCSGRPTKMADLLAAMIRQCRLEVTIQEDPRRLRGAGDVPVMYGSYRKIQEHTGWAPRLSLEEGIADTCSVDQPGT
ncbi:MAG: GDP-mannose 4,6-dehydratase [Sedimentisphaerales bacterium]|nr:GDP-mannose 4,6-dehydratase [Sedimentisphaerales bacterium]